jgi:hypothetical protein
LSQTYVGGHDGGLLKDNSLLVTLLGLGGDGHVGESNQLGGDGQGDSVGGLGGRLIPAGEGTTGIGGLELGDTHVLGLALGILVRRAVETGHLVAQNTVVGDAEDGSTLGELRVEGESGGVTVLIECGRNRLDAIS